MSIFGICFILKHYKILDLSPERTEIFLLPAKQILFPQQCFPRYQTGNIDMKHSISTTVFAGLPNALYYILQECEMLNLVEKAVEFDWDLLEGRYK